MKPLTNKTSVNIDVPASSILNDSIPVQEAFPERLEKSNNSNDYSHTPPQYLRNGSIVCSAHEMMIKVLDKQDKKLDDIDSKVDQLLTNQAVHEKEEKDNEKEENKHDRWLDIGLGSVLTLLCLIGFEVIKYLTPL